MGCLGAAFGILILVSWAMGGTIFLAEQKASGETLLIPILVLAPGLLIIAGLLAAAASRVVPGWRRGRSRGPTVMVLVLGAGALVGIFLAVDANVANRRPSPEVTAALAPVCAGTAVPAAGRLVATPAAATAPGSAAAATPGGSASTLSGPTANHLVVLAANGAEVDWTGQPKVALRPPTVADAEMVVCVDAAPTRTQVEVCHYINGPDVTRYAETREVDVFEAATGRRLLAFTAVDEARTCSRTEKKDVTELNGDLTWGQVEARLWPLVERGVDAATLVGVGRPTVVAPGVIDEVVMIVSNSGWATVTFSIVLGYPTSPSTGATTDIAVVDLGPGESRLVSTFLADFAPESSLPMVASAGGVVRGKVDAEGANMRSKVTIESPAIPAAGTRSVAVTVQNASTQTLSVRVLVVFTRAGNPVAYGRADVATLAPGSTRVTVELAGDASGADAVLGLPEWVHAVS